ncbi:hypothetical protein JCM33374_g2755 [Metschnikowia sp. JCM 33374]|nr:hypothetical protein JCM33374_g2755 [Metschnikowia sp. JCM 33374]
MMYATKLGMEDNQLVLNNNQTTVYYHENGGLSFYANGNYINIDDEKRLVLGDHQDEDFGLEAIPGEINYFKKLSYRMNENFQLCSDNSIRYQSSCDVVRRISIRYEQDWSYETMMRYPLELPPGWFGEDYTAKRLRAHG